MPDFSFFRRAERTLALTLVLFGSLAAWPAAADDSDGGWLDGVYSRELGTRFWYGWGSTGKDLYGADRGTMVSRLTYKGLTGATGEVYGQINEKNYFVKGFAGLGTLMRGTLQDEDFVTGLLALFEHRQQPERRQDRLLHRRRRRLFLPEGRCPSRRLRRLQLSAPGR